MVAALRSYLAALGRTQVVLWVTLAGVGVNLVLAWVLIFGRLGAPELGVRGAALASVTVQVRTSAGGRDLDLARELDKQIGIGLATSH